MKQGFENTIDDTWHISLASSLSRIGLGIGIALQLSVPKDLSVHQHKINMVQNPNLVIYIYLVFFLRFLFVMTSQTLLLYTVVVFEHRGVPQMFFQWKK